MDNFERKSKKKSIINLPVNLETEVITSEFAGHIVVAILESILFQRNQIPFVFQTFKHLVSQFENNYKPENDGSFKNLHYVREKDKAKDTLKSITDLSAMIYRHINNCDVSSIRLLIGSTVKTPKEAYIIKLPNISKNHCNNYHRATLNPLIKKTLLSLLTSDQLYEVFSKEIVPTNIYLEMEMVPHSVDSVDNGSLLRKDCLDEALSCQLTTIHLNVIKPNNFNELECCKNFKIFCDTAKESSDETYSRIDNSNISNESLDEYSWYEASTFIRGYKDKPMKGKSIWQNN